MAKRKTKAKAIAEEKAELEQAAEIAKLIWEGPMPEKIGIPRNDRKPRIEIRVLVSDGEGNAFTVYSYRSGWAYGYTPKIAMADVPREDIVRLAGELAGACRDGLVKQ